MIMMTKTNLNILLELNFPPYVQPMHTLQKPYHSNAFLFRITMQIFCLSTPLKKKKRPSVWGKGIIVTKGECGGVCLYVF